MKKLSKLYMIFIGLIMMTGPVAFLTGNLIVRHLIGSIPLWVAGVILYSFGVWLIIKNAEDEK